jgi:hypothetical protein
LDNTGNLYIADLGNNKIRKVFVETGIIITVAGTGAIGYSGDNGPATNSTLSGPYQLTLDSDGNVLFSDAYNSVVRKISMSTGIITTVAGNDTCGYSGNGGVATNAKLCGPAGIFIGKQNDIYIAEWDHGVIRKIDAVSGVISLVAGSGTQGYAGDGGPATNAQLNCEGVCIDNNGIMYIADYGNHRIRKVYDPLTVNKPHAQSQIKMYPNPAKDQIIIEDAKGSSVRIFNLLGQEVYKTHIVDETEVLNIRELINGIYLLHVIGKDGSSNYSRFVKE